MLPRTTPSERKLAVSLEDKIIEQLKLCFDPEIPVNIYDLGLIYKIEPETPTTTVRMSFTSESCPSAREIPLDIRNKVLTIDGIEKVDFEIVWEPQWHPRMISAEARAELGIDEDAMDS
jgi:metal-sulfur cluster biosynthetic enzyme